MAHCNWEIDRVTASRAKTVEQKIPHFLLARFQIRPQCFAFGPQLRHRFEPSKCLGQLDASVCGLFALTICIAPGLDKLRLRLRVPALQYRQLRAQSDIGIDSLLDICALAFVLQRQISYFLSLLRSR